MLTVLEVSEHTHPHAVSPSLYAPPWGYRSNNYAVSFLQPPSVPGTIEKGHWRNTMPVSIFGSLHPAVCKRGPRSRKRPLSFVQVCVRPTISTGQEITGSLFAGSHPARWKLEHSRKTGACLEQLVDTEVPGALHSSSRGCLSLRNTCIHCSLVLHKCAAHRTI